MPQTLVALVILACPAIGSTGAALGLRDGPGRPIEGLAGPIIAGAVAIFWCTIVALTIPDAIRRWRQPVFMIDQEGLSFLQRGGARWLVPWSDIAGLGVGYELVSLTYLGFGVPRRDRRALTGAAHGRQESPPPTTAAARH